MLGQRCQSPGFSTTEYRQQDIFRIFSDFRTFWLYWLVSLLGWGSHLKVIMSVYYLAGVHTNNPVLNLEKSLQSALRINPFKISLKEQIWTNSAPPTCTLAHTSYTCTWGNQWGIHVHEISQVLFSCMLFLIIFTNITRRQ